MCLDGPAHKHCHNEVKTSLLDGDKILQAKVVIGKKERSGVVRR